MIGISEGENAGNGGVGMFMFMDDALLLDMNREEGGGVVNGQECVNDEPSGYECPHNNFDIGNGSRSSGGTGWWGLFAF